MKLADVIVWCHGIDRQTTFCASNFSSRILSFHAQGPVVWRLIWLVSFLLFKSIFSDNFLCYLQEHPIINLLTKRIRLNLLLKLSYLNSNFALTLGYLNSPTLGTRGFYLRGERRHEWLSHPKTLLVQSALIYHARWTLTFSLICQSNRRLQDC